MGIVLKSSVYGHSVQVKCSWTYCSSIVFMGIVFKGIVFKYSVDGHITYTPAFLNMAYYWTA